jgi:energy-coupling factor transporter ATP-binding protein EcfA2
MISTKFYFKGYRCFKDEWAGFEDVKSVNVIIGRNNTGKSHLLKLVQSICEKEFVKEAPYKFSGTLDESSLQTVFRPGASGGILGGDEWRMHGKYFVGEHLNWVEDSKGECTIEEAFQNIFDQPTSPNNNSSRIQEERRKVTEQLLKRSGHQLTGKIYRHLAADRDIQPETENNKLILTEAGSGATNIIRRLLVTSNESLPTELIQGTFLSALKSIFGEDARFTEIQVKHHDETEDSPQNHWEVFLREEEKGLVPLSRSGSGLKTVILVLLNLLVLPEIEAKKAADYVFCFEEVENNLHPALQRRLLQFIEDFSVENASTIFLTTHSSTALDLFGVSEHAQIVHVTHDGTQAYVDTVQAHFDKMGIVSELGAKPSDLLQANGVIWVEGPSDCLYVNKWIEIISEGRLKEGRDYQCAFYGGALLARTQFTSPEEADEDLINLLRVNPNIAVICDGDRTAPGARLKGRVRKIKPQIEKIPNAHLWITEAREIENYLPGDALNKAYDKTTLPDPSQYENFFHKKTASTKSYLEKRFKKQSIDKMELAALTTSHMTLENMSPRFDWLKETTNLVETIRGWNA